MPEINQCVIFAGGKGERLGPATLNLPKPMYSFRGKPFIHHLIDQMAENGITEVIILTGYLEDNIRQYFKKKNVKKIRVRTHFSPVSFNTGARLKRVEKYLKKQFLLIYGDNYLPDNIRKIINNYDDQKFDAQVTLYDNEDNYSKSNVGIKKNLVITYDKTRKSKKLKYVDIGYMVLKRKIINSMSDTNFNFESLFFKKLISSKKLQAYVTKIRYFSVTSLQRIQSTDQFFSSRKFVFIDRDGVLNKKPPKGEYIKTFKDFIWKPNTLKALKMLKKMNIIIIIITNQAGIGRKMLKMKDLNDIHIMMCKEARAAGGEISYIYVCPHHWQDNCICRKPMPGLFYNAQKDLSLNLQKIPFIGDSSTDEQVAKSLSMKFYKVNEKQDLYGIVKKYGKFL